VVENIVACVPEKPRAGRKNKPEENEPAGRRVVLGRLWLAEASMRKLFSSDCWRRRRADAPALTCLSLFFVAFFPQGLFGGKYLLRGDAFFYSYPMRTVAWRMIRQGELPLWTPYIMSGYPLLSMAQLGLAYPLTWGYLFLPGYVAEQIYVLAPFLLTPLFVYAYVREIGRSRLAALLAGLVFGYGGMMASPLANNGFMPNAVMWLPLLLVALERASRRPFVPCLLLGTGAYAMSVLTGYGQGFLYTGLLAVAYACFLALAPTQADNSQPDFYSARLTNARRWRPLLVVCSSILLAAGVAAFQLFETAGVVGRSVRSDLSYEIFTQGSFAPALLWKSLVAPPFYAFDMHAYVLPLALALAFVAVYAYVRRHRSEPDPRVLFWLAVAVVAIILMLGQHTPFYRLVYHTPLLNRFRVPSRHTFEWTFAVGVLAAYGWDTVAATLRRQRTTRMRSRALTRDAAIVLLAVGIVVGVLWWLRVQTLQVSRPFALGALAPTTSYCLWKSAFVLLTVGALWRAALVADARWRKTLVLATLLVLCYVEPSALVYRWWGGAGLPASRFQAEADATHYLKQFPTAENRVYTRVALTEQFGARPRFDCANVSAVAGLHNVAGYEPLLLERYSRALGGVGLDSVLRLSTPTPDPSLLAASSHVLDILNTSFVLSYSNLAVLPESGIADGNIFADMRIPSEVQPQTTSTLTTAPAESDSLLLVTSLANSVTTPQGTAVAHVRIHTTQGIIDRELRAGVETAEWAHDRPDVRAIIKHDLAPIFDSHQIDGAQSFPAYRYKALLPFGKTARVTEVEITNVTQSVPLGIYSASLLNSNAGITVALGYRPADTWQPVYEQRETLILRNTRALPRAWLVAEAEAMAGEEALQRIRGESATEFDPRRTALLEVRPEELPQLPGGVVAPNSGARITRYEANRLQIETSAPTATVLVVSEIFYPGWVASVDSQPVRIDLADYLLRGIVLSPGPHSVEMYYAAPAARSGAILSALTLCLIVGLGIHAWRRRAES
jgi:Bacterial membrane protein YfhO